MAPPPKKAPKGVKPGNNYFWNGQEWVWIQKPPPIRPTRTASTPSGGGGLGGGRRPGLSIDQWARQQANRLIGAQVASINSERESYLDELRKNSELEAQRGRALAEALQGMNFGGKIQSIYGTGAADLAGLAGGFSEGIRGQADAQAAEMANMLSGTGQEAGVRNEGVGMADVNYGLSGFIPGRSMVETGAAFGAQAALEPSFAARIGQLEASRLWNEGQDGLKDFALEIAKINGQRPELVMDLLEQRRGMVQDEREWRMKQQAWALQMAEYYAERGDKRKAEYWKRKAHQLSVQKEQRYAAKDQGLTPDGRLLPGFRWRNPKDHSQGTVKIPTKGAGSKGGGAKPAEVRADMSKDVAKFYTEVEQPDPNAPWVTTKVKTPWTYAKAFATLWAKYKGTLPANKLRRAINEILAAAGIKKKQRE